MESSYGLTWIVLHQSKAKSNPCHPISYKVSIKKIFTLICCKNYFKIQSNLLIDVVIQFKFSKVFSDKKHLKDCEIDA